MKRLPLRCSLSSLAAASLLLAGCASSAVTAPDRTPGAASARSVPVSEALWLDRLTFGVDSQSLADYRRLGRNGWLERQLHGTAQELPPAVSAAIAELEVARLDPPVELVALNREYKRINELADPTAKEAARRELNERGNRLAYEASRRLLLESIYSRSQLQEQMVWFWLNHFSVFQYKANLRWLLADYEARAIRPQALGHFRDLVMATLVHPAMLQYLDNAQNAAGHVNENYARELMELHTLGVSGGYTQHDVQELARVLTGVGVWGGGERPHLRKEWEALYRREGALEFNPARHDFGAKVLLGRPIASQGFAEVEEAVDRLVRSPACARFIARRLAMYFVADAPTEPLVQRLAATFTRTDGDIAAVLGELVRTPEFEASLGHKFRDPYHFVVGAIRLAYDGRPIANTHPPVNWLNALGEPLYGRPTPDGYPQTESGWASSGQLGKRFEIARALGSGNAGLFEPENGSAPTVTGFPRLASRLYFEDVELRLSGATRSALEGAASQQEWNTLLLSSPELNYR